MLLETTLSREDATEVSAELEPELPNLRQALKQQQKLIEDYQMFLERFRQDTNFEDVDEFVHYFQNMDDKNLRLYSETKVLNDEVRF